MEDAIQSAEILSVGTEILLGDILNTNAQFIASKLAQIGIPVYRQVVVGDNPVRLEDAFETALNRSDLVIATGGLGPTYDDITKETLAKLMGVGLVIDKEAMQWIHDFFATTHMPFTENNKKQALVPEGSTVFQNANGSAPGFAVQKDNKTAILLPGPPYEMEPMFETQVIPYLLKRSGMMIVSNTLRLFGIGESQVEHILRKEMEEGTNPTIAPYAKRGEVELRITARGPSLEACTELINPVSKQIEQQLGRYIYARNMPDMQTALVQILQNKGLTIATAESCTGGLLSERITQVSGASNVFGCGICAYANEIKQKVLGVQSETLEEFGAVSAQTASEMAHGVRRLSGADIGLSTTGIAGPTGGTDTKPVGTVFVGIATDKTSKILELHLKSREKDERERIRHLTALHAFSSVINLLKEG